MVRQIRRNLQFTVTDGTMVSCSFAAPIFRENSLLVRRATIAVAAISISALLLYAGTNSFNLTYFASASDSSPPPAEKQRTLESVLENAADANKTVILTTLNEAWAAPNSLLDLFIKSFTIGEGTRKLLDHLVVVALDQKAYSRCRKVHKHCYALYTKGTDFHSEAFFMTPTYLQMMWRRIDFLRTVLEMGYNFVFTDADIMWFRDPFPRFYQDADFQIACDNFLGNSDNLKNRPNGGFNYVRSNNRSIEFYKFWYTSRERYPGLHDQDALNRIKFDPFISSIGLKIKFLNTAYFGGLCEPSRDFNSVCTMHANCCYGMDHKLGDMKLMLRDWRHYKSSPSNLKFRWSVPHYCSKKSGGHAETKPLHLLHANFSIPSFSGFSVFRP